MTIEEIIKMYEKDPTNKVIDKILWNLHTMQLDDVKAVLQEALYTVADCNKLDDLVHNIKEYHI